MVLETKPAMSCGNPQGPQRRRAAAGVERVRARGGLHAARRRVLFTGVVVLLAMCGIPGRSQTPQGAAGAASQGTANQSVNAAPPAPAASLDTLLRWQGLPVVRIRFAGVGRSKLAPLPDRLAEMVGKPLSRRLLRESLHELFATGLYDTLAAEARRDGNGVDLIFRGEPRQFIGRAGVYGAKGATVNTQLNSAAQLSPGTRFTQAKLERARRQMRETLAQNGYYEPKIKETLTPHPSEQLVDITYEVDSGRQARVGTVEVVGDSGMSVSKFRRVAHMRSGTRVNRDTVNRALAHVLKHYQRQDRMEAEIKLEAETYVPATRRVDYRFSIERGPVVKVVVEGATMDPDDVMRLIPIYTEGTVDEDLLNEGSRRLRNFFERKGYFDVKVEHQQKTPHPGMVEILYTIRLGQRRKVEQVLVQGNHYFSSATLEGLLNVRRASTLNRHGTYSQALVSSDVSALEAVYQNNGFANVKVTPQVGAVPADSGRRARTDKPAALSVIYHIDEGRQVRVGSVQIVGNKHVPSGELTPLLNTTAGQLLSPRNLGGDRNALLSAYLSRGFDRVQVTVAQKPAGPDPPNTVPTKMDVTFNVDEGPQTFVRNVLVSGLHYTRPATVARVVTVHPGDPLDASALTETQRNLYDFGLFNEVNAAVQNPAGAQTRKSVLLQVTEARRWALTYGFGFEAQTGQPVKNCKGAEASGIQCSPSGKTGVSPRVLASITRSNLFGREESASVQATYGLLEQSANLLYQIPHFEGNRNFGLTFSGGYANSQDVTTYVASRLESGIRWTENFQTEGSRLSRANTFVYEYDFRRVKVAASSLQVCQCDLTALSTATRVAGPSFTWIRDTRDSPLDAHHGTYTSFQDSLSIVPLGAEAEFNRIDVSNSSYYSFDRGRFVLARNTRYGQVRAFGGGSHELIPLPERLYAGGAVSLRSFSQNAAGPRDPETGYPVGGAGVLFNQTELRLPAFSLPWVGDALSFVIFHDMGNVFANAGDAWASIFRIQQPHRSTCGSQEALTMPPRNADGTPGTPPGPITSTGPQGLCSFNYFTHAPGLGMRYNTPIGPLRLDIGYDLNPPIYPVTLDYSQTNPTGNPHVGQAPHINFFFSFGQAF